MNLVEIAAMLEMQAQLTRYCIKRATESPDNWENKDPAAQERIMTKWQKEVEGYSKAAEIVRAAI